METLADAFPDGAVERASIDEAYVDVTREVDAILRDAASRENDVDVSSRVASGVNASGFVRALRPDASVSDRRLALGADACRRARAAVFEKTGYTMSGGIAHNKMLAKLASARNKPNKQTVVSRAATAEMLETLPMRSIKGLGGKLGERVERALVEALSNASEGSSAEIRSEMERKARSGTGRGSSREGGFTAASLRALFSSSAPSLDRVRGIDGIDHKTSVWLERVSRGEDDDKVVANVRDGAKSVTAFKSFKAVFEKEKAHRWLKVLAFELAERLHEDRLRLRRAPKNVRLEYRAEPNKNADPPRLAFETRSKTFAFPKNATTALVAGDVDDAGDALAEAAFRVFDSLGPETTLPCTRVGLAASDFVPTPVAGNGIERFFKEPSKPAKRRVEHDECLVETEKKNDDDDVAGNGIERFFKEPSKPAKRRVERDECLVETEKKNDVDDVDDVDASVRAVLAASDEPLVALRPPDPGTFSAGEDASSPFVACPRCGLRTAPGRDAQSHADEHMAFDLSKSEPQHRFGSFSSQPGIGGEKKRRPAARNGGGGKKRSRGDASGTASVSAFFAKR
jgi:nucleotidyltransferase/DNA polymerase involved in DNA repair